MTCSGWQLDHIWEIEDRVAQCAAALFPKYSAGGDRLRMDRLTACWLLRGWPRGSRRVRRFDPPADDPLCPNADHIRPKARHDTLAAARQHLGFAPNLDPANGPRVHRRQIVDHVPHLRIAHKVTVMLPLRKSGAAADVDAILLGIVAEPHRHHVRLPIWANRGDAANALTLQISD